MKKAFAILLFFGVFLQAFSQAVIIGQYYANKDYIAKNLCENKDKPQMHCEGKCCLKKKLAKEGKEQSPSSTKSEQVLNLFFAETKVEITHRPVFLLSNQYFNYNDLQTISFPRSAFHPPTA